MKDLKDTTAVILVGGKGTRLQSVISEKPKCMAAIQGRPMLTYLLDQLILNGINKVVLCTGYQAAQVREIMGSSYGSLQLFYSHEDQPLGTAGAIRLAKPWLDSDPVLVMNGDSYCRVDLRAYFDWFMNVKASVSLLLTQVSNAARYGSVKIDSHGRIVRFVEKREDMVPELINAGIYWLSQQVITSIPAGQFCSIEKDVFPQWIGKTFYGYVVDGDFLDIGTPESYAEADQFFSGISAVTS